MNRYFKNFIVMILALITFSIIAKLSYNEGQQYAFNVQMVEAGKSMGKELVASCQEGMPLYKQADSNRTQSEDAYTKCLEDNDESGLLENLDKDIESLYKITNLYGKIIY
ncbi:MAG: hypothetical protein V7782_04310, partial [Psychromonas sp.]